MNRAVSPPPHGQAPQSRQRPNRWTPRRRFVTLTSLQWLSAGLAAPILVLLLQGRGLSLTGVGAVFAVFTATVGVLELPTGGLADSWGRRRTLILAAILGALGLIGLATGVELWKLIVSAVLFAGGRALSSGPLDAWFVDRVLQDDPAADLTPLIAAGERAQGLSMAAGILIGSLLPHLASGLPSSGDGLILSLSIPALAAAGIAVLEIIVLRLLIDETVHRVGTATTPLAAVRSALGLASGHPTIRRILTRYALAGFGVAAFEILTPLRLETLFGSPTTAASTYAILTIAGFTLGAFAAPLGAQLTGLFGTPQRAAAAATAAAGFAALTAGVPLVPVMVASYVGLQVLSSPAGPLLGNILHAEVSEGARTALLSLVSLAGMFGAFAGSIAIPVLAQHISVSIGFITAGLAVALGAIPLLRRDASVSRREGCPATTGNPSGVATRPAR